MVKCEKYPIAPQSLAIEKKKGKNGKYNMPDVMSQLAKDFSKKCYICELGDIQDPEVEHLVPHHNSQDIDAKFDWNNLFLSCRHCNGIKNHTKYDGKIINCCVDDPEEHLHCQYNNGDVSVVSLDEDEKSIMTAELINEVFNLKNTGTRVYTSEFRMEKLKEEMLLLINTLIDYKKAPSTGLKRKLGIMLSRNRAFASFKRDYVRDKRAKYTDLHIFIQ